MMIDLILYYKKKVIVGVKMSSITQLPKRVALAIMLLDLRLSLRLIQMILYLWREFSIKTEIIPVIQEYKISFHYKDERLSGFKLKDLKELIPVIEKLKEKEKSLFIGNMKML